MSATTAYGDSAKAAPAPTAPMEQGDGGGGSRLAWALADSWTMTRRELAHWARQPVEVVVGLAFPVMLLLMFAYLVGGGRGVDGDPTEFLVPGMLALTMAFGLEGTMLAVTQDLDKGVIDRFRALPMVPGAVLVGRSAADMLQSVAALAVMTGVGHAVGWRWHNGAAAALAAVGLLLLLRFAMLWVGIHLAMVAGRPNWSRRSRSWSGRSGSSPTSSPPRRRCRGGWARWSSGTRCPPPPPPYGSCSATRAAPPAPGPPSTPNSWRSSGRRRSSRCSSRWRCGSSPGSAGSHGGSVVERRPDRPVMAQRVLLRP